MNNQRQAGFTLIEVIVAVAIIVMLVSVIFFTASEARNRARVVAAYENIQQVETALLAYMVQEQRRQWPTFSGSVYRDNTIEDLVENGGTDAAFAGFDAYLSEAPDMINEFESYGYYALTGEDYTCSGGNAYRSGVNIRIGKNSGDGAPTGDPFMDDLFDYLDEIVDQNDGVDCGTVRRGGGSDSLYYLIAPAADELTI